MPLEQNEKLINPDVKVGQAYLHLCGETMTANVCEVKSLYLAASFGDECTSSVRNAYTTTGEMCLDVDLAPLSGKTPSDCMLALVEFLSQGKNRYCSIRTELRSDSKLEHTIRIMIEHDEEITSLRVSRQGSSCQITASFGTTRLESDIDSGGWESSLEDALSKIARKLRDQ